MTSETTDAPGEEGKMEAKRSQLMDRLTAKDEARRADADARRAEAERAADPRENVDAFLRAFEDRRVAVLAAVDAATAAHPDAGADATRETLDALLKDALEMEKSVAEASYFLPPYDARACAAATETTKGVVQSTQATLLPKKKFSFSSRKKKEKAKEVEGGEREKEVGEVERDVERAKANARGDSAAAASAAAKLAALTAAADDGPGLRDLTGETCVVTASELREANGTGAGDYVLVNLTDVTVFILGAVRALRCHNLKNVRVYGGPVEGSVHAQGLDGCHLEIATRQMRIHDARNGTAFYLRTKSRPIIEHSTGVGFAPFTFSYDGSEDALARTGMEPDPGTWREVDDFGWIKQQQSPNWRIIPEEERVAPPPAP